MATTKGNVRMTLRVNLEFTCDVCSGLIEDVRADVLDDFVYFSVKELGEAFMDSTVASFTGASLDYWLQSVQTHYGQSCYNQLVLALMVDNSQSYWVYSLEEHHIYGSSRLGINKRDVKLFEEVKPGFSGNNISTEGDTLIQYLYDDSIKFSYQGATFYELSNHLRNVLTVITDRKLQACGFGEVMYYKAQISSVTDYYPFGMQIDSRTITSTAEGYRFGFNGQEKDNQVAGDGNSMSAEFWQYDARLGRRWNVDPRPRSDMSPFVTFNNCPVFVTDIKGDTGEIHTTSKDEANQILSGIMLGFEVTFQEQWTEMDDGSFVVKIFDSESFDTDETHSKLNTYVSEVLNSAKTVYFNVEKDDPNFSQSSERNGGMEFTVDADGKMSITIAEKYFTGNWGPDLHAPRYEYLLHKPKRGESIAYFVMMGSWKKPYAQTKSRIMPFDEAFAHEIVHAGRFLQGTMLKSNLNEENATRKVMNSWRQVMNIPPRGYEEWSSYLGVLGGDFRYSPRWIDEY